MPDREGLADWPCMRRSAGLGAVAAEIYADLGLRFDGEACRGVVEASAALAGVRQDAALMLQRRAPRRRRGADFLRRWLLVNDTRATDAEVFVLAAVARLHQYYVEGYRLLRGWLDDRPPR